jgi:hypothetical protein
MSYIGRGLQSGAFRQLDDISSGFDGSDTTHTMQVNSTNVTVGDVNQILLSLGGVIQKPGTDFTVSSSTLTFTTAPAANTSFFAVLLGSDNGGTVTPTDLSVTTAKIAADNVTPPKTNFFNTDPGNAADLGMLHIKSGDSGASVSSTSDELVIEGSSVGMSFLDATDGATRIAFGDSGDNDIGKIVYGHSSNQMEFVTNTATGLVIDGDGHVTMPKQPAFAVKPTSNQSDINCVDTHVTVAFGTEIFDVNADYTPNTFTAPVTGKYQLQTNLYLSDFDASADYLQADIVTSNNTYSTIWETGSEDSYVTLNVACTADMDANDTAYVRLFQGSGAAQVDVRTAARFSGHLAC